MRQLGRSSSLISLGIALLASVEVHAQVAADATAPQDSATRASVAETGDIIVTAQKRNERLQDVPVSITAASGEQLKAKGVTTVEDLGKLVPGFTSTKSSLGAPIYFIRGVGFYDDSLGVSPAVMTYVDQVPLPLAPMARGAILDLERVEVLKGPQGTLFGQNTTGGAVNYIAAKPTDEFHAGIELTGGRFADVEGEGYISGPLTDTLKARVAVRGERADGWQKGYTTDQRLGRKRFINGRLLLDWEASSALKFELSASGWKDTSETQAPQIINVVPQGTLPIQYPVSSFPRPPEDNRAAAFDPEGRFRQNNWQYQFALRGDLELGNDFTLTSLSSFAKYNRDSPIDQDGTTYQASVVQVVGKVTTFAQEVRLSGPLLSNLKITAGANYEYDKIDEEELTLTSDFTTDGIDAAHLWNSYGFINNQKTNTYSVFGSLEGRITDTLSAQAGLRYTKQNRDFAGCSRDLGDGQFSRGFEFLSEALSGSAATIPNGACGTLDGTTFRPTLQLYQSKLNEDNVSWRGNISWQPSRSFHLYANVTKGYKSGSFPTLAAALTTQFTPVSQESVLAYEIGTKLSLFDRKIDVDAAGFYYDYRNKQLLGFANIFPFGPLRSLVNIPKSKIQGIELNVVARPVPGWQLSIGGTYIESKILSDPGLPIGPFGDVGSFKGDQFPFTPKWQGVFDTQYKFSLNDQLSAFLGGTVTSRTSAPSALYTHAPTVAALEDSISVRGYTLVDARAGIEGPNGRWTAEVFGRNIFNTFWTTAGSRVGDYVIRYTGNAPTYGVTLRFRY
ncbi:hypothetical protein YP76_22070 [Sphingobium chungbukense]|uniref:TonB-dependent receptor n=1 Tax=Sphingobium chungbukense TaxID=56193 RepID=A0A0M3AJG0_9SPHN|nr:hypothetical protein YP76_22070 [Sphingobium chungbukense]